MTARRTVVLGMGNILYGDEGVGVYAARFLEQAYRFSPAVEVVDGATLGFGIMDFFREPTALVVADALAAAAPAGSVFRLPAEELRHLGSDMRPTAHEVDPVQLLRMAPMFGTEPEMTLLGIVPENASDLRVGLTPTLEAAFGGFVDAILTELASLGVDARRVAPVSLGDVVDSLVTGG